MNQDQPLSRALGVSRLDNSVQLLSFPQNGTPSHTTPLWPRELPLHTFTLPCLFMGGFSTSKALLILCPPGMSLPTQGLWERFSNSVFPKHLQETVPTNGYPICLPACLGVPSLDRVRFTHLWVTRTLPEPEPQEKSTTLWWQNEQTFNSQFSDVKRFSPNFPWHQIICSRPFPNSAGLERGVKLNFSNGLERPQGKQKVCNLWP